MLLEKFAFKLARFSSLDTVDWSEVLSADIVQIGGHVLGGMYHSEHMVWRGDLTGYSEPVQVIKSKRERKHQIKAQQFFADLGYTVKTVEMNEALFKEFKTLYEDTTLIRERPLKFDLDSQVLGKIRVGQPVQLVGLFQGEQLISGLLFSVFNDKLMVSFGAKRKFKVRGGAGGMLEYELARYCIEEGIMDVTHGTTTNPAGLYTQSGVFEFKARYGYSAYPMGRWYSTFIKNAQVSLSDFVFVGMAHSEIGYVVVSDDDPKELLQKYATREVANVEVLSRTEATNRFDQFLKLAQREDS